MFLHVPVSGKLNSNCSRYSGQMTGDSKNAPPHQAFSITLLWPVNYNFDGYGCPDTTICAKMPVFD